jgi:hypothetical protein
MPLSPVHDRSLEMTVAADSFGAWRAMAVSVRETPNFVIVG